MALWKQLEGWAREKVTNWLFEGRQTMATSLDSEEKQAQDLVILARKYYAGTQAVKLIDRQKEYLAQHGNTVRFTVNQMPTIVDAAVERLQVIGFDVPGEAEGADPRPSELLWEYWEANRMDAGQTEAHRWAIRDGEAFVLVDWDEGEDRPTYVLHPRFTETLNGGDGYGMWAEYPNDDYMRPMTRAVKRWTEVNDEGKRLDRKTVYYPDRIEKYALVGRKWEPHRDEADGEEWPIPWLNGSGAPLGIPVVHLKNPGLTSALKPAIPLQDALNKAWLDLLAAADTTAFRTLVVLGFVPTKDGKPVKDDGSNLLHVLPGGMLANVKNPGEASVTAIDPASLEPLLNLEDQIILRMATITRTPLSRFLTTRQIAGAETIKQQDAPLLGRVRENQTLFGNAWEDVGAISFRLAARFGRRKVADINVTIATQWARPEIRDEQAHMNELQVKQQLGVDDDTIWSEMGYSEEYRERFRQARLEEKAERLRQAARIVAEQKRNGTAEQPEGQPAG